MGECGCVGKMDRVLELLQARRWEPTCLRTNIASPDQVIATPTFRKARVESNVLRPGEHALREAIQAMAPEWHENTRVILNRNVVCQKHRDGANEGLSWILVPR